MTANMPELFIPSQMSEKRVMAEFLRFITSLFSGPLAECPVDALVCHPALPFGTVTLIPLLLGVLSEDDSQLSPSIGPDVY